METCTYASVTNTQRIGGIDADKKVRQIILTHPAAKSKPVNWSKALPQATSKYDSNSTSEQMQRLKW